MKLISMIAVFASVAAVPAVFAAPQINGASISIINGADANGNGYYETVSFHITADVSAEDGATYDAKAKIFCTTTGQAWQTDQWTLSGAGSVEVPFTESDFTLSDKQDLQFRVELWDAALATKYAETTAVQGAPVKVEPLPLDAPPAPLVRALSATSAEISVDTGTLPEGSTFTVQCVSSAPADDRWSGKYLLPGTSAQPFDSPVWRYADGLQGIVVDGLSAGTSYTFAVQARYNNSISALGSTAVFSSSIKAPGQLAVLGVSGSKVALKLDPNGNSDGVHFAVKCSASLPVDPNVDGLWLNRWGQPSPTPVWGTAGEWAALRASNLQEETNYTFVAAASLTGEDQPVYGPAVTALTTVAGDANGDCKVNILDLIAIRNALNADPASSAAAAIADINDDGAVNVIDMIICRNRLYASCN